MSAYCDTTDLLELLPSLSFSETTKPSGDQAEAIIDEVTADMRGVILAAGFDPDTTDTSALLVLQTICAYGAASRILLAARGKETELAAAHRKIYEDGLARIRRSEVEGLAVKSSDDLVLPVSGYTANRSTYPEPVFKIGTRQW